jgi:GAF domain-containing protein
MLDRLINYLLKRYSDDHLGQRAEIMVALSLGTLSTMLLLLFYQNPTTIVALLTTNVVGFLSLYQVSQGRHNHSIFFPTVAAFTICAVTIVEGAGTHDLLWMGNLGLFLIANIQRRRNFLIPIVLAILMVATFTATGMAEIYGRLPNQYGTTASYVYLNSFFFAVIMAAIIAVFNRHYSLLRLAAEIRDEQIDKRLELQANNQALENRLAARSRELNEAGLKMQERSARLLSIMEISQDISSSLEQRIEDLLRRITQIISAKLNFYHVGIFLLDENRQYAVLRAANSPGGQRMLERHHQLKVGGTGIVGYVAQGGQPRIALDTGADAVFFNNPDLPGTRSEMAIPMKYGSQVIGVLDLQSVMPSAFKEEDADLLSILANQIALAAENVSKSEAGGFKFSSYSRGNRAGLQPNRRQGEGGYSFNIDGTISAVSSINSAIVEKALSSGETVVEDQPSGDVPPTLTVPVKFRDQIIGIIHVEAAELTRNWTEDEITVVQSISERAAFALENARLFEEANRRAKQEEAIAHITSQIGASTNFDRILQTTIEELGRTLGATRTFIQLEAFPEDDAPTQNFVTD